MGNDILDYLFNPLVSSIVSIQTESFREIANKGHKIRLSSSFVDFDNSSHDPVLGHNLKEEDIQRLIESIIVLLDKLKNRNQLVQG